MKVTELIMMVVMMMMMVMMENVNTALLYPEEEVVSVRGVSGRPCNLPCRLNPRNPGDKPKLILWYKQGQRSPVFSYDGREPQLLKDIRSDDGELTVVKESATLTLTHVRLKHAGLYECRVEFFRSPTHTRMVNLTIIEPPTIELKVKDRHSGLPKDGILGPYQEGVMVIFTCLAREGWPLPNVTWWRGEEMVDSGWEVSGPRLVRNDLVVSRLGRDWHNHTLTCTATNTDLLPPVSVSATILMHLLPTSVEITGGTTATEGQRLRLRCTSKGSRPSAQLTWLLQGSPVPAEKENTVYGRVTSSILVVNVSKEHNGATVTCTAANPAAPGAPISNTTQLTVHYGPSVKASLGGPLKASLLKEGDDIYFTCSVDANPPITSLTWYHEGIPQVQNISAGVLISGDSLVVQTVKRERSGKYRCKAENPIGAMKSNSVTLKIKYRPECQTSPTTYFIYDKPINVSCTVASHPPPISINWQWNSSTEVIGSTPSGKAHEKATAHLKVFPETQQEDRALSCWAVNEMGRQRKPCSFSLKVAKMPMPLSSCRLANITASSLSLTCKKPDTSALGITLYRAEVYFDNDTLFENLTSLTPSFNVSRLDADTSYQIKVYVTHGPVMSQPFVVSAYTSRTQRPPKNPTHDPGGGSVMDVMVGVAVSMVVMVMVVIARQYCRRRARRRRHQQASKVEQRPPSDDSNPDVVPTIAEETYDLLSDMEDKLEQPLFTDHQQQGQGQTQQQQQLRPQQQKQSNIYSSQELYKQQQSGLYHQTQQSQVQKQQGLYSSEELYQQKQPSELYSSSQELYQQKHHPELYSTSQQKQHPELYSSQELYQQKQQAEFYSSTKQQPELYNSQIQQPELYSSSQKQHPELCSSQKQHPELYSTSQQNHSTSQQKHSSYQQKQHPELFSSPKQHPEMYNTSQQKHSSNQQKQHPELYSSPKQHPEMYNTSQQKHSSNQQKQHPELYSSPKQQSEMYSSSQEYNPQKQDGLYKSEGMYEPSLLKATVAEITTNPPGVRTYCPSKHTKNSEESTV